MSLETAKQTDIVIVDRQNVLMLVSSELLHACLFDDVVFEQLFPGEEAQSTDVSLFRGLDTRRTIFRLLQTDLTAFVGAVGPYQALHSYDADLKVKEALRGFPGNHEVVRKMKELMLYLVSEVLV